MDDLGKMADGERVLRAMCQRFVPDPAKIASPFRFPRLPGLSHSALVSLLKFVRYLQAREPVHKSDIGTCADLADGPISLAKRQAECRREGCQRAALGGRTGRRIARYSDGFGSARHFNCW